MRALQREVWCVCVCLQAPDESLIQTVLKFLHSHTIVLEDRGWAGEVQSNPPPHLYMIVGLHHGVFAQVAYNYTEVDVSLLLSSVRAPGPLSVVLMMYR